MGSITIGTVVYVLLFSFFITVALRGWWFSRVMWKYHKVIVSILEKESICLRAITALKEYRPDKDLHRKVYEKVLFKIFKDYRHAYNAQGSKGFYRLLLMISYYISRRVEEAWGIAHMVGDPDMVHIMDCLTDPEAKGYVEFTNIFEQLEKICPSNQKKMYS